MVIRRATCSPGGAPVSADKADAPAHLAGHQDWIRRGVDDGVFLLVGVGVRPGQGGAVLATGLTPEALRARGAEDPFVVHDVVTAEVLGNVPNLTDPRPAFLAGRPDRRREGAGAPPAGGSRVPGLWG